MKDGCGMFSLKDKVIVVTGGTRRYGYLFCEGLAGAGGTVILTSRAKKRADETAGKIKQRGWEVSGYELDLARDDSIEEFVAAVIRDHGRIDVLVNNARTIPEQPPMEIGRDELDKSFAVNCTGTILLSRRVSEEMRKAGGGNIINIGSIYGMGGQDLGIYKDPDASFSWDYPFQKGGVIVYTKQLATVLARYNIRSNCLSLGGLWEESMDREHFVPCYSKRTALGRMTKGEDVKGPIVFLASDASAYMTGANLVVDGGWTAW